MDKIKEKVQKKMQLLSLFLSLFVFEKVSALKIIDNSIQQQFTITFCIYDSYWCQE